MIPAQILALGLTLAASTPPLDCTNAHAVRSELAREEIALLHREVDNGRLSPAERRRVAEIRATRRRLLVCG